MLPGIDVSHYQGVIDWSKVKAAGIQFAYLKATQGASYSDPLLKANVDGANAAGIPFGLYHVFLGLAGSDQVANFIAAVQTFNPSLPMWFDIEPGSVTDATNAEMQAVIQCLAGELGQVVIYCSPSIADQWLDDSDYAVYPLAIAHYDVPQPRIPKPWTTWQFWQHSCTGTVDGISTSVDLDWFNGDDLGLILKGT